MNVTSEDVYVVAPNRQMGRSICSRFHLPQNRIRTTPESLRGLHKGAILFYANNERWNPQKLEEIQRAMAPSNHSIIGIYS